MSIYPKPSIMLEMPVSKIGMARIMTLRAIRELKSDMQAIVSLLRPQKPDPAFVAMLRLALIDGVNGGHTVIEDRGAHVQMRGHHFNHAYPVNTHSCKTPLDVDGKQ